MKQSGFTLMELLIVATIIGVLAALAFSNYALFKANAYNATAESDARNLSPAAELAAADAQNSTTIALGGAGGPVAGLPGATTSPGTVGFVTIDANHYFIETEHPKGSLRYAYDSDSGRSVLGE